MALANLNTYSYDLYLRLGTSYSILLPCTYYRLDDRIPVAAHIDRSRILSQRKKKLGLPISLRYSLPAFNVSELKLRSVTPTEPLHDPYLVALLIALGQLQWRVLSRETVQQAAGVTVCTLSSILYQLTY